MIDNFTNLAANERTFLAWTRTAISIVGFGIVATRLETVKTSGWSEIAVLLSGGLVVFIAYIRMLQLRARIKTPKRYDDDQVPTDYLLLFLIAALFGLMVAFVYHVG